MAALAVILGIGVLSALMMWTTPGGTVYSVADVQQRLAMHPRQWAGRTILVRGVFQYSTSDPGPFDIFNPPSNVLVSYALYQPGARDKGGISGPPLVLRLAKPLADPRPDPLTDMLRRISWLRRFLALPQTPVYRITLLPPRQGACPPFGCPAAQLDERPS